MKKAGQPDTEADLSVRRCIDAAPVRSFVMTAGAGSGKTTSLVKALAHLVKTRGDALRQRGQKVACITYTEIAADEIREEVGGTAIVHVSTIHSFLWTVIRPFQENIRAWVDARIQSKIVEAQETIAKKRVQAKTRERAAKEVERLGLQRAGLAAVPRFTYSVGSDYLNGILGHDDIVTMTPELIQQYPLLQDLISQRFPFVFVDESQDTTEAVVRALASIDERRAGEFCLGLYGDAMQKIYATGIGKIPQHARWDTITKPENFRCPDKVLAVINKIRAQGDGLTQTRGNAGPSGSAAGTARMFLLPSDEFRKERLLGVRRWLAEHNRDEKWLSDAADADVRVLVVVHRMVAKRLGFEELYAALNDDAPSSIKDGVVDGTAWPVVPFITYLLPLVRAFEAGHEFQVMELLRTFCPLLDNERLRGKNVAAELAAIKRHLERLVSLLSTNSAATVGEVLRFVRAEDMADVGERLAAYTDSEDDEAAEGDADQDENESDFEKELATIEAFLTCPASQLRGYQTYIEDESPFATQQGIKGAEFSRVLVIVDDEDGSHPHFSYNKFFQFEPLSAKDEENRAEGKDSVLDRTRRLFYVCCSRAMQDLGVVLFVPDVDAALAKVSALGMFPREDIHVLLEVESRVSGE